MEGSQSPAGQSKQSPKYKTDGGKSKSNAIEIPSIALPKGGGAIKGIDQKFSVNAVNGTAALSIPLPVSQARGLTPSLSLSYNSGGGNSIFGLGWSLSLPSIKRKTDKELPHYFDNINSDTYLISDAEDLVPELERNPDGSFKVVNNDNVIRESDSPDTLWKIRFYKPRIEGLFARIERWTLKSSGEIKWRVISKDNVTTLYGWSADGRSRISNPQNNLHVFEWLPELVIDDKGNCTSYKYKSEDANASTSTIAGFQSAHYRNRISGGSTTYTNKYISQIFYGNKTPFVFGNSALPDTDFMFEIAFDYGEYNQTDPHATLGLWDLRSDAFSEYKSGFEIRTTRLCKRVLLFHHFPNLVAGNEQNTYLDGGHALVKSLDLTYSNNGLSGFTFLVTATSKGYIRRLESGNFIYSSKSLPPFSFSYATYGPSTTVKEISVADIANAPTGLSAGYSFTDLFNDGLQGILTEQNGAWYYKDNLGNGKFAPARTVSPKPSFSGLNGNMQLLDLESNGLKQLVNFSDHPKGYFEITDNPNETKGAGSEWHPFRQFKDLPNINFKDPNIKLIDLNGDGKTDLLIADEQVFTWYESTGKDGFTGGKKTPKFLEDEEGPKLVFTESEQTIFLADMSGDGLIDLVRIRNGEVSYWPNLGYGRFGKKISMDNAPVFDSDADFNPTFIKLSDIDGSGTPDILYLGKNRCSYWRNFSGNSFSSEIVIHGFPSIHPQADVTVTDLLGNGLSCIVWSSSLSKDAQAPLRYIDLMDSKKPHILTSWKNGLGLEVSLEYTPSTTFFLADKANGQPWATRLHFPVHCLSKVTTTDRTTGHTLTSTYSYHHGYYDHAEKEFRGFGRVDQIDQENSEHWQTKMVGSDLVLLGNNLNQPPILTRSWFHTGAFISDKKILAQFENEYWFNAYNQNVQIQNALGANPTLSTISSLEQALPPARIIGDNLNAANSTYVQNSLSLIEKQEAYRACKSMPLRVEIFALDAPNQNAKTSAEYLAQLTPYQVSTHNCVIELLQPLSNNKHAVWCVKECESISYSYERRNTNDPRVAHNLNLELDIYGNVLKSVAVVYPRLQVPGGANALTSITNTSQAKTAVILTVNEFTNDIWSTNDYRLRLPFQSKTYEVTRLYKKPPQGQSTPTASPATATNIYDLDDFANILAEQEIPYENLTPSTTVANIRLIEHVKSLYFNTALTGPLTAGQIDSRALPYENYQLAYTENTFSDLINNVFGSLVLGTDMLLGQFEQISNDWWVRSGTASYLNSGETVTNAAARFFGPVAFTNQYGSTTTLTYDNFFIYIASTVDAMGNTSSVNKFNYRTLSPSELKDQNDNLSEVLVDELGLPKALIVKSKNTGADKADEINTLTQYTTTGASSEQSQIDSFFSEAYGTNTSATTTYGGTLQTIAKQLLDRATQRFAFDFNCYDANGNFIKPACKASISREAHYNISPSNIGTMLSFEYSSGAGKVVMAKAQAEPGEALQLSLDTSNPSDVVVNITTVDTTPTGNLRWIGNGRTILNNKGNPVMQYEPYFSTSAAFESAAEMVERGVTPLLKYDALGRLIRTDFPDGTYSKNEYYGWKQIAFDQNDTCFTTSNISDPNYNVWYNTNIANSSSTPEYNAANKASKHANTPKVVHFDTLGRPVTEEEICYNEVNGQTVTLYTHLSLDVEGNLRSVIDPKNLVVMQYKYDMLGQLVYQNSMDAGQRWLLHDCLGSPLKTWDERNFEIFFEYDALHRPKKTTVLNGDGTTMLNNVVDFFEYGDEPGVSNPKAKNLRGNLLRHWDTAGMEETADYYFSYKPKKTERWLAADYKNVVDWNTLPTFPLSPGASLELTSYSIATQFDALGRIAQQTPPDGNVITPVYNARGAFYEESVNYYGTNKDAIKAINYDAKGQRTLVRYGNDVYTAFTYDPKTFRVSRILTYQTGPVILQDLNFWYDPVGNISFKRDDAFPDQFYNNQVISASSDYIYDSLYKLMRATGRENAAAINFDPYDNWDNLPHLLKHAPSDQMFTQNFTQTFLYDNNGNIMQLKHQAGVGTFTRDYTYSNANNRLLSTTVGTNVYNYNYHPQHGFITDMPHLPVMAWNFKEELVATSQQFVAPPNIPETTYYQYDSQGQRIRKITENQSGGSTPTAKCQRIYIAGYEHYDDFNNATTTDSLSLIDQGQRFVMFETSTDPNVLAMLIRFIHPNHQSSCTLETDGTGALISFEEYHPYGTTAYQAMNKQISASAKRYRYTGMERDEETGLSYHTARYYMPWLGRWLSSDPIGIGDGLNVYAYCQNSPLTLFDLTGSQSKSNTPTPFIDIKPKMGSLIDQSALRSASSSLATPVPMQARKPAAVTSQNISSAPTSNNTISPSTISKIAKEDAVAAQQAKYNAAISAMFTVPQNTASSYSGPQFNAVTPFMQLQIEASRRARAEAKYFDGMADFNRRMITDPAFQMASTSLLFGGFGGLITRGLSPSFASSFTMRPNLVVQGLGNASADFAIQMYQQKNDLNKWNYMSTIGQFGFSFVKSPVIGSFGGSAFGSAFYATPANSFLSESIFGKGRESKSFKSFTQETIIGGSFNLLGGWGSNFSAFYNPYKPVSLESKLISDYLYNFSSNSAANYLGGETQNLILEIKP